MKQYKLIKCYPGSPKLNTVIEECYSVKNQYVNQNSSDRRCFNDVHQYPEFWEEIIEKDYEILSFKQNSDAKGLWTRLYNDKDKWSLQGFMTNPYTTKQILNNFLYSIQSVKRLSDGEVFTVGDLCRIKNSTTKDNIVSFTVNSKGLSVYSRNFTQYINDIEKVKQPVFTTEDGVDMFEGDDYWAVSNKDLQLVLSTADDQSLQSDWLKFLTRATAEEYILMNKPCLSINDVSNYYYSLEVKDKLKHLVQSKL